MFEQNTFMKKTIIHKLNPVLKFTSFIFFIVMIFLPLGFFAQTLLGIVLTSIFFLAKIKFKTYWNIIKSSFILFLIMFLINWVMFKTPLSININSFNWFGNASMMNGPIAYGENGIYISEIWGGSIGLSSNEIFLNNLSPETLINIINQNNVSNEALNSIWNQSTNENKIISDLFPNNELAAKHFKWLINNSSFKFNGIDYTISYIDNYDPNSMINRYFIYQSSWYTLSPMAIQLALYIALKVWLMILVSTILTETTNSQQLTYALESLMSPLRLFKLPTAEASMIIAIALRFIPSLLSESKRIQNAQASRGIDAKNGSIKDKFKSFASLIIPLFSIAFKKSDELANAMESRAYNPRYARTKYRLYKISIFDWLSYFVLCLLFGFLIIMTACHILFTPFGIFEGSILV